jgi:hypothetical protein
MAEENRRIFRDFFDQLWNKRNLSVIDDAVANDFSRHDPASPDEEGRGALKQMATGLHAAFPDGQITVEDSIAEANKKVLR